MTSNFDAAHVHLLVNHFPIILSAIGLIAALVALATRRRAVWVYALATLTISGVTAYPVMLTGHAAEDVMEKKWYVVKDAIHEHEEASDWATWMLLAMGVASAYGWYRLVRQPEAKGPPAWVQAAVIVTALLGATTSARTAWLGGKIVYGSPRLVPVPPGTPPADTAASPEGEGDMKH